MTVWYLNNEDCSGVFSTKDRAIASLKHCAEQCEWQDLEIKDHEWWCAWSANNVIPERNINNHLEGFIQSFELDEDYNA